MKARNFNFKPDAKAFQMIPGFKPYLLIRWEPTLMSTGKNERITRSTVANKINW
jgi:hypothetical protein